MKPVQILNLLGKRVSVGIIPENDYEDTSIVATVKDLSDDAKSIILKDAKITTYTYADNDDEEGTKSIEHQEEVILKLSNLVIDPTIEQNQ